jgi:hypothetical protein
MLNTSKDILWLALAAIILWIGFFAGLSGFYLAMMLRDLTKVTSSIRRKMDTVDKILETIKNKAENASNYLPMIVEGATKAAEYFKNKQQNREGKRKKK